MLADCPLRALSVGALRTAWAPKIIGAAALHEAMGPNPITSTVFFSSLAALLGNPGQSAYANSNASLDAIAQHWQIQVHPNCVRATRQ